MGFIESAADGALQLALERVRKDVDVGQENLVPEVDPKQRAELLAEQRDGRTDEPYRRCLESHGFVFVPAARLQPYADGRPHEDGEWGHRGLRLAFTTSDLPISFPGGPESLDRFIREHVAARKMAGAPKTEVRRMLRSR